MATEDDNFDIDIYGDGTEQGDFKTEDPDLVLDNDSAPPQQDNTKDAPVKSEPPTNNEVSNPTNGDHAMGTDSIATPEAQAPHGVKRKEYDDRQTDPDATTALLISDLFWWTTDDEIRGWIAEANSEDDLKDVTFSEHKVNGKSKGQAFVEFTTPQAATATKHTIENKGETGATGRKYVVTFTNPHTNPFRTLPKDAPMRKDNNRGGMTGGYTAGGGGGGGQNMNFNNMSGGYRGRGGYNRGMGGNFNNNRGNFTGGMGFQGGNGPANMMGGFQGNPMGMQNYGFNRGGMMGNMRGGPGGVRGGRGGNMMGMPGMNPMNTMGMNPMNPMMGNMGMGGNMGQGFQGPNPAFNQQFFNNNNQGTGGGDASWNPHGAKRSRQE